MLPKEGGAGVGTLMLSAWLVLGSEPKQARGSRESVREGDFLEDMQSPRGCFELGLTWGSLPADFWLMLGLCGHCTVGPWTDAHVEISRSSFSSKAARWWLRPSLAGNGTVQLSYQADELLGCSEPPWPQQASLASGGHGAGEPGGPSRAASCQAASPHHPPGH